MSSKRVQSCMLLLPIKIHNPQTHILCQQYLATKLNEKTYDNNPPITKAIIEICNPLTTPIISRILWSVSNSFAITWNQLSFQNCTYKWTFINLQNFLPMIEIQDSTIPYISPTLWNIFPTPSFCNNVTTLLLIEKVIFHMCILRL